MSGLVLASVSQLSPRDHAILQCLTEHRYLNTQQIEQFYFSSHASRASASRSCRRVLERLHSYKILVRVPIRRIGGWAAGSSSYVYGLSRLGQSLLTGGQPLRQAATKRLTSPLFLDHSLEIASTHIGLVTASRKGSLELVTVQTEPYNWRSFSDQFGVSDILKPDLYVVTAASPESQYEDAWFLEIDRSTASGPVILRKCRQYIAYHLSSDGQRGEPVFPLVVWLVPDEQRCKQLELLLRSLPEIHQHIFRVIAQKSFVHYVQARYYLDRLPAVIYGP